MRSLLHTKTIIIFCSSEAELCFVLMKLDLIGFLMTFHHSSCFSWCGWKNDDKIL